MIPLRPWLQLLILLRIVPTLACDAFTNPTLPDLSTTFTFGDKVDIHWNVDSLQYVNLLLHHWGSNYISTLAHNQTNDGTYFWTIGKDDNVTAAVIKAQRNFVLVIQDPDGSAPSACGWVGGQVQSPGFIITTTASSTSTSATPTSTTTTSSIIATTTTPAATTSAAAAEEGGLSTGASAGIGAGIGAAVILFEAALGLFFYTRRKNAKKIKNADGADEQEQPSGTHGEPVQYSELSMSEKYEMDASRPGYVRQGFSELTATTDSQELDGRAMVYELDSGDCVSRDSIRK